MLHVLSFITPKLPDALLGYDATKQGKELFITEEWSTRTVLECAACSLLSCAVQHVPVLPPLICILTPAYFIWLCCHRGSCKVLSPES